MSDIDDPYRGQIPELIWAPFSGDLGGLRQLDQGTTEKRGDYWTVSKLLLERDKIGERLQDKRVIEIGPGDNTEQNNLQITLYWLVLLFFVMK